MKKKLLALLAAALLLAAVCPAALAQGLDHELEQYVGQDMPDFTVTAYDGRVFTLSEALKEKELVLVNFWATWCPPCMLEFPFMQEAYAPYSDKVEIVALSTEPADTDEVIARFAQARSLTFPMARDGGWSHQHFQFSGIPTTFAVDRFGKIVYAHSGCLLDSAQFTQLFDAFLGEDYTETRPLTEEPTIPPGRYAVMCVEADYTPVPGFIANFCTDTFCMPVASTSTGIALFAGDPGVYHVQIVKVPAGYALPAGFDGFDFGPESNVALILLEKQ